MLKKTIWFIFAFLMFSTAYADEVLNISTRLMRSTFKIQQENHVGTIFILGQRLQNDNARMYFVLLTATHVLDSMKDDYAIIYLRKIEKDNFVKFPYKIKIRSAGQPLWVSHPKVDVSAMRVDLPHDIDIKVISTKLIADDDFIKKYEVNPGDDLLVLGYPYGSEANSAGFPILRSGRIASYPLIPTENTKTFLLDFEVYGGNSGGPVFMCSRNRAYGGTTNIGVVRQLMGIVIQEKQFIEHTKTIEEESLKKHSLSLAVVVHSSFLKDLLSMLPPVKTN